MSDLCRLIWCGLIALFRSRAALEVEILVLRHQLHILRRKSPKRVALSSIDRLLLVGVTIEVIVAKIHSSLGRPGCFLTASQSAVTAGSSTPTRFRPSYVSLT